MRKLAPMTPASERLPHYLKKYAATQAYEKYTSEDHAAWRYIMRQNRAFFSKHAVPVYLDGLKRTGIPLDRIPRITEMDECLSKLGWGAVPVIGFIPPAAFLEFQALGILPIACDMRTISHLAYTPAPDIVHEAAGHAPIIAHEDYAAYLHRYAQMAQKAIQSIEDIRVYEAIRYLSDIKENPDTKPEEIARAEERLKTVTAAVTYTSEGTRVARMAWWTVEYGLVGKLDSPLIYGAGLLSSVGESQHCLSDRVKKIPLSVECVEQSYDITEPQPQLFVARGLNHLVAVLEDLEKTLSFKLGGAEGLRRAQKAETMNTVVLDSGLEVSGVAAEHLTDGDTPVFFKMKGPVHLATGGRTLPGHARDRHPEGFSSPIGPWENSDDPAALSDEGLSKLGLRAGQKGEIRFRSGFQLKGTFVKALRDKGRLIVLTFKDASVTRQGKVFFDPSWGEFDLAVGTRVTSVYGGPADRSVMEDLDIGSATTNPGRSTPFTPQELKAHDLYRRLRDFREKGAPSPESELSALAQDAADHHPDEWLAGVEVLEMVTQKLAKPVANFPWAKRLEESLRTRARAEKAPTGELIEKGLALLATAD
jgi:phenylalanine-4-hydroxylase